MMYLILGESDPSIARDPEERKKTAERFKKDLDSGEIKMFGVSPDGRNSFVVTTQDEKWILTRARMAAPAMKMKVMPMLSFDEYMDVMKELQP